MVENLDAVQIRVGCAGGFADFFFVADERDFGESVADAHLGGLDGARVFAFGQNDMLRESAARWRIFSRIIDYI